jgi:molybdenum cofactor synthesis domain-containing protein
MNRDKSAAIVIIGAEVLSAKVQDENAPFLLRALRARGVEVTEIRTIGDVVESIAVTVRELASRVDHVITTGGIGPTHDDVTIAAVAKAFGLPVVRHREIERRLRARHGDRLNEARLKLAEVPEGSVVTLGAEDIVPVIEVRNVLVFPGVPSFMRLCFERIATRFAGRPFYSRALLLASSESLLAAHLSAVQAAWQQVAIGSYPRFDDAPYRVKVTLDGRDEAEVEAALAALRQRLEPASIVGELSGQ